MLLLIIIGLATWSVLAVIGIHRGLSRRLVVFRGWGDVALTAALIVASVFWLLSLRQSSDAAHTFLVLPLLLLVHWFLITKAANRRWLVLGLSIPAKLTLVMLALLAALLALSSAVTALSRKSDARTRLTNAAVAVGAAVVTVYLCRTIRRLVSGTPSGVRSSGHYYSKVTIA